MTHIPYRGTGQSVPALLGGHVQVLFSAYPSLAGAVESKKVKLLANNGAEPLVPGAGRAAGRRGDPGFRSRDHRRDLRAPGMPQAILDKIAAEAIAAANTPEAKKQLAAAGIEPAGGNAAAFGKALKREIDKVNEVVKSAGIEPQ